MINKKKLIAYLFVAIMVISAFAGISSVVPASNATPHATPSVSAVSGGTIYAYYGEPVSFPSESKTSSATNTACHKDSEMGKNTYPPPDYVYPSYPSYPSASPLGWSLDIGSTEIDNGSSTVSALSHSQSQSTRCTHQYVAYPAPEYWTYAYAYSHSTSTWCNTAAPSYTFENYGSSSGSSYTWTLTVGSNSESGTIVVYSYAPYITISSASAIDLGQSLSITTSITNGASPYTYSWSSSGASGTFSSTTSASPTWIPSAAGTATLTVTVTQGNGETYSNSTTITIDPALSISISPSYNPADNGQDITYDTSVSGGSGTYSSYIYVLYDGTSTSDSELTSGTTSSFSYTYDSTGSYLLVYSVTDSNSNTVSASLTQTVNSDTSVAISSSQNPTDSGKTVEFTSSVSGGTSPYNYTWEANGNDYYTKDINVTFSSSGSYTIDLTVRDAADYSADASMSETVNSDPTVSASSNVSSADINYPIEFSSRPSGGTSPYTYSWTIGGTQVSTSQDFSYSFSTAGTYTVEVTLTDSIGETYSASVTE